jgi:hypothetical protein
MFWNTDEDKKEVENEIWQLKIDQLQLQKELTLATKQISDSQIAHQDHYTRYRGIMNTVVRQKHQIHYLTTRLNQAQQVMVDAGIAQMVEDGDLSNERTLH